MFCTVICEYFKQQKSSNFFSSRKESQTHEDSIQISHMLLYASYGAIKDVDETGHHRILYFNIANHCESSSLNMAHCRHKQRNKSVARAEERFGEGQLGVSTDSNGTLEHKARGSRQRSFSHAKLASCHLEIQGSLSKQKSDKKSKLSYMFTFDKGNTRLAHSNNTHGRRNN